MTTPYQAFDRQCGIGGSEAAAAVGLSPWKTPHQLWLEKTGEVEPPDLSDNDAIRFGVLLEDVVAQEYARRAGVGVQRVNATLQHATEAHMFAHIDRRVIGVREGLECKTASLRMAQKWGEQGTDEIPLEYAIQATHYLAVTGYAAWHVAVLIAGSDFRVYRVERDEELISNLIDHERTFWRAVQERVPPDVTCLEDASARWPLDRTPICRATPQIERALAELAKRRDLLRELEAEADRYELAVKAGMGDAGALVDAQGNTIATWKAQGSARLDQKALAAAHPDIVKQFRTTTQSRVFRLSKSRSSAP